MTPLRGTRGFSIEPLAKAMAQIELPVDLTGLTWRD